MFELLDEMPTEMEALYQDLWDTLGQLSKEDLELAPSVEDIQKLRTEELKELLSGLFPASSCTLPQPQKFSMKAVSLLQECFGKIRGKPNFRAAIFNSCVKNALPDSDRKLATILVPDAKLLSVDQLVDLLSSHFPQEVVGKVCY